MWNERQWRKAPTEKFDAKIPQPWLRIYTPNLNVPVSFANLSSKESADGFRFLGFTVKWGAGYYPFKMPFFMVVW